MMETSELMLAVAAAVVVMAVLPWIAVHHARTRMLTRCMRLEETLHVYNNANLAIGRHLGGLESELRELRQRVARLEEQGAGQASGRPAGSSTMDSDPGPANDAELRLSHLIRSRLARPRAVV